MWRYSYFFIFAEGRQVKEEVEDPEKQKVEVTELVEAEKQTTTLLSAGFEIGISECALDTVLDSVQMAASILQQEQSWDETTSPRKANAASAAAAPLSPSSSAHSFLQARPAACPAETAPPVNSSTGMGRESATTATVGLTRLQRCLLDTVRAEPEGVHGEDFSRLHAARFRSSLQAALGGRKLKEVLLTIPHVRLERRAGSGLPTWHYRAENGTGETQVQT